ncbi:MAG: purine-nucleoside phosphorylase [Anaerolineae bacterium]
MNRRFTHDDLLTGVRAIQEHSHCQPRVVIILGSGLNSFVERLAKVDAIPYSAIPFFPEATVPGHSGWLLLGNLKDIPVAVMQGRAHYYEGYSLSQVTFPIRVLRLLGASILVVTNAAGAIRQDWSPGQLMAITDHINLPGITGHNPLRGPNDELLGPRFPSMSPAYDIELLNFLREEAQRQGIILHEGVYVMVCGPNFETPAEIRFLRSIGADAVGMSTVPEVLVARHAGMRVLGISCISNITVDKIGETPQTTQHEGVLNAGLAAVPSLTALIEGVLQRLNANDVED